MTNTTKIIDFVLGANRLDETKKGSRQIFAQALNLGNYPIVEIKMTDLDKDGHIGLGNSTSIVKVKTGDSKEYGESAYDRCSVCFYADEPTHICLCGESCALTNQDYVTEKQIEEEIKWANAPKIEYKNQVVMLVVRNTANFIGTIIPCKAVNFARFCTTSAELVPLNDEEFKGLMDCLNNNVKYYRANPLPYRI